MKEDLVFSLWTSRSIYAIVTIACFKLYLFSDNSFHDALTNLHLVTITAYLGLYSISLYLFWTCDANPGYVTHKDSKQQFTGQTIELHETDTKHHTLHQSLLAQNSDVTDKPEEEMFAAVQILNPEGMCDLLCNCLMWPLVLSAQQPGAEVQATLRFCHRCNVYQPLRAKHCNFCVRCVRTYDHHCYWIGSCVGEENRRRFYIFLVFQTALQIWSFFIVRSGLYRYMEGSQSIQDSQEKRFSTYFLHITLCLVLLASAFFTGGMLVYQSFLIATNQTTWEHTRSDIITYLKQHPKGYRPFDRGIWNNIRMVFFETETKEWELPKSPS